MTERRPIKNFGHPDKPHVRRSYLRPEQYVCYTQGVGMRFGRGHTIPEAMADWLRKFHEIPPDEPTIDWIYPANGGESA